MGYLVATCLGYSYTANAEIRRTTPRFTSTLFPLNLDDALGLVERDAQGVADWAINNGLELNTKKKQVTILGSAHYTSSVDLASVHKIRINDMPLAYATEVKNLGVTMNQAIECNEHVSKVQRKVYAALASMRFYRRSLSFTLKTKLIKSLVIPHFDYASVVYMHVDNTKGLEVYKSLIMGT